MDILSSFKTEISMYEEKVTLHSYSEDAERGGTRAEKCLVENTKQSPFQPTKKNSSDFFSFFPVWEYFSYLLWILGYLANIHITNRESEIKSLEKNKIFNRTCWGYSWLTSQYNKPKISLNLFVRVLERIPYLEKASKSSRPEQWNKEEETHYFCFNFKIRVGHSSRTHFEKL